MSTPTPGIAHPSEKIAGVYVVPFRAASDSRGLFFESFRRSWIPGARQMVQGNCSFSKAGVLRGLHYHLKQADFWVVPSGRVRVGLYDLRLSSPTRGASERLEVSGERPLGLYIPKGVAHGYYAVEDSFMTYLVDEYYDGADELGVRWDDPAIGLDWGTPDPVLSDRDRGSPVLSELPPDQLPP